MAKTKARAEGEQAIFGVRISRSAALLTAAALILLAVLATFLAFQMITAPRQLPPPVNVGGIPTTTPAENYTVSPLVQEYNVDSTPQLVINCNHIRVGTFASAEDSFRVSPGTERQDLINSLCSITGREEFCSRRAETDAQGAVLPLGKPSCEGAGGKAKLYAFHSPSCGMSTDQRPILDALAAEFPNDIELIYICAPVFGENDEALCARQVASGVYGE